MKNAIVAVLIAVLLPITALAHGSKNSRKAQEQNSFCEGDSPEGFHSTALPAEVVKSLMNSEAGDEARKSAEGEGEELDASKLFRWTKVRLTARREVFYLVIGSSPMSGADNTWFWIVRQSGKRATILLWAGGNCMDISRSRTAGYRDVETTWSSPSETVTTIYKYDGGSYKLRRSKSSPNNFE